MCNKIFKHISFILCLTIAHISNAEEKQFLNIYSWANYISPKIIKQFSEETGITVLSDVFDSEEMLDAKIMLGHTGYDIVFPSSTPSLINQIRENVYLPIDKKRITNYRSLNKKILQKLSEYDPQNKYVIPWLWGMTGIGYNKAVVEKLIPQNQIGSLHSIFNPEILKKVSNTCKIEWFFSPPEMIGLALIYKGIPPQPLTIEKLHIAKKVLQDARPYIYKITSSYNMDLIKGNACVVVGWIGDIAQIIHNSGNKETNFALFKEGFIISIDNIAIPKDAKNIDNAYKFINFLLKPEIIAQNSNFIRHMNTNTKSLPYLDKQIVNSPILNPPKNILKNGYTLTNKSINLIRLQNRIWTYIVSNIKE